MAVPQNGSPRSRNWLGAGWIAAGLGILVVGSAFLAQSTAAPRLATESSAERRAGLVLWAWERPEDLRFLGSMAEQGGQSIGVAPLVGTLRLSATGIESLGRRQPLIVPRGIETTAVVRIEVLPSDPPRLSGRASNVLVESIVTRVLAWLPKRSPRALQIDFDARHSERDFYRRLLRRLRSELPATVGLEITALASWCVGDPWLADLPIDDAVPMFFRMGQDDAPVRHRLAKGRDLSLELCRGSVGVATDEPWPAELLSRRVPGALSRRVFVFHPRSWDAAALRRIQGRIQGRNPDSP